MPSDRVDPNEIATRAGGTLGIREPGELDDLAGEQSMPEGAGVVGHGDDMPATPNQLPYVPPPIGVGGEVLPNVTGNRPEYLDTIVVRDMKQKLEDGDLDGTLSLLPEISGEVVAHAIVEEIFQDVIKLVNGDRAKNIKGVGLLNTAAFEIARHKVAAITDAQQASVIDTSIDQLEGSAIIDCDESLYMKLILTMRLKNQGIKRDVVAKSCSGTLPNTDSDNRTGEVQSHIYDVLRSLEVPSELVDQIKLYITSKFGNGNYSNGRDTITNQINQVLASKSILKNNL